MTITFNFSLFFTLCLLVSTFYGLIGWLSARYASWAMPAPDLRVRPQEATIQDAARLLQLELPATNDEIRQAMRALMPRAPGDTLADGRLKNVVMAEVMDAADILETANSYDANPPFEAKYLLEYWEYRAGVLGRLWARYFPPAIVRMLRYRRDLDLGLNAKAPNVA